MNSIPPSERIAYSTLYIEMLFHVMENSNKEFMFYCKSRKNTLRFYGFSLGKYVLLNEQSGAYFPSGKEAQH